MGSLIRIFDLYARTLIEMKKEKPEKNLYLFDFDGTITRADTLLDFLKFSFPNQFPIKMISFLPDFILLKLRLKDAGKVKEKLISSFMKGLTTEEIKGLSAAYFMNKKERLLLPKAVKFFRNKVKRDSIYIVSASLDLWLLPFAEYLDAGLICTEAEFEKGVFTGEFKTPNCNYEEKKIRILKELNLNDYGKVIAFGNSKGDFAMYSLADVYYENHFK